METQGENQNLSNSGEKKASIRELTVFYLSWYYIMILSESFKDDV